jgi:hypothetical protein
MISLVDEWTISDFDLKCWIMKQGLKIKTSRRKRGDGGCE